MQTSAPAVPQMMSPAAMDDAASKMTGQRNENSVLFSLAVLTKDAGDRPGEEAPRSTSKNSDDSGLIDLKALAAKAESMRPASLGDGHAFASPLGLASAPLGSPLGLMGSPLGEAPQKSKLPLIIGGGAGIVLLLVLGIVIGVKVAGGRRGAGGERHGVHCAHGDSHRDRRTERHGVGRGCRGLGERPGSVGLRGREAPGPHRRRGLPRAGRRRRQGCGHRRGHSNRGRRDPASAEEGRKRLRLQR